MSIEASLAACEEIVRRADPDRYFSALFAPAERRPLLFALYAFNHELAQIGERVREPMMGEIRLEWWREAVEGAREGRPRAHDVARGLAEIFARSGPPSELFETVIAARRFDIAAPEMFSAISELETYADATSGNLMRIAARLLDERMPDGNLSHHAGVAYGLTGILRASEFHAARGKSYLPKTASAKEVLELALSHYAQSKSKPESPRILPAILPAALVPLYAKRLTSAVRGASRNATDVPVFRRQWAMLRAVWRKSL